VHRGEHVGGDREDLETDEQDDQVVGRRHRDAARGRQQHQHVPLGSLEALTAQVAVEQERTERDRDADGAGDEQREPVQADRARHDRRGTLVLDALPQRDDGDEREGRSGDGPGCGEPLRGAAAHDRHDGEQQDAAEHEHQVRRDRGPDDLGHHDGCRFDQRLVLEQ
jgi:hypothetical protein